MVLSYRRAQQERTAGNDSYRWPNFSASGFQVILAAAVLFLAGCHSALIDATVSNRTAGPISLVQVEYPSASFGTQALVPGQDFHYRFKVLGSGAMKITYTDASQAEHKATGPTLQEGQEGTLKIVVTSDRTEWQPMLLRK